MSSSDQRPRSQRTPFPEVGPRVSPPDSARLSELPTTPLPSVEARSHAETEEVQTCILPATSVPAGAHHHSLPRRTDSTRQLAARPQAFLPGKSVIIRGDMQKPVPGSRSLQPKHRLLISLSGVLLILLLTGFTLLAWLRHQAVTLACRSTFSRAAL